MADDVQSVGKTTVDEERRGPFQRDLRNPLCHDDGASAAPELSNCSQLCLPVEQAILIACPVGALV
jgi:hypothetical protein